MRQACLFLIPLLISVGRAEEKKTDGPKEVVLRFVKAGAERDEKKLKSCFDQSSDLGKAATESLGVLLRAAQALTAAEKAVKAKFGEKAIKALHKELSLIDTATLEKQMKGKISIDKGIPLSDLTKKELKVFSDEEGNTAQVRLRKDPSVVWEVKKHDGKWYLNLSKEQVVWFAGEAEISEVDLLRPAEQVPKLVKKSDSVETFRKKLRKVMEATPDIIKPKKDG